LHDAFAVGDIDGVNAVERKHHAIGSGVECEFARIHVPEVNARA
jgi:hypothetical protein